MFANLLIANRGEIALRIAGAAADLGLACTAVWASDDGDAAHVRAATSAQALGAAGPAAYLDIGGLLAAARAAGCDALHPGYGFLSERADFASACIDAGLAFVGPTPEQLQLLGDKARALSLARSLGVPVLAGSDGPVTLDQARRFIAAQDGAAMMLKAVAGGGGRGLRVLRPGEDLATAFERCSAEAQAAFGVGALYVERWLAQARHVEVQVAGDGEAVAVLGERECTLQRQHQKLVEVAPSPSLDAALRQRLFDAALAMARTLRLRNLATFEFLLSPEAPEGFVFIEANPRLQVEHTVTEAVTGLDLVQLQLALAAGERLHALGVDATRPAPTRGMAVQWRINAETLDAQGRAVPASGRITQWQMPLGTGLRIDTAAAPGDAAQPQYDSLLAKLVVQVPQAHWPTLLRRSVRALAGCRVEGLHTNLPLLRALAARPELERWAVHTGFVQDHIGEWLPPDAAAGDGSRLLAPMAGRVVECVCAQGDSAAPGATLAVLEAMKMQHELSVPGACRVQRWRVQPGTLVQAGDTLALLEPLDGTAAERNEAAPTRPREDLHRVQARWAGVMDAARAPAIAARHARGQRSARENVAATCDAGSFIEYGAFAVAAQRQRRSEQDLIAHTPADGMVTGIGHVGGARAVVMAYDATVLAGTQGMRNHQKTDRLLGIAARRRLPVVLWAEGGGGRPGDVDMPIVAGLHVGTFASLARLSGQVPLIGIAAGRCFAGNAALLGCCDVVIATRNANIGMGGPAMVEGGGLGVFKPEQIGPAVVQAGNGVVDVLVADEAEAAAVARRVLGCLLGALSEDAAPDPLPLREAVPAHRLRVYDAHAVLASLFDSGSVIELRSAQGPAVIAAVARLQGRPVGVLCSDPAHGGGAIDAAAAQKAAWLMGLCQTHGLPLVSLIDTPGFMVGPAAEEEGLVRHAGRLFTAAAALRVPVAAMVLRRAYGLGAMALAGGGFHEVDLMAAWPGAEFGAMGLEGAVRLGWRKELEAAAPGAERDALFAQLLAAQVAAGGAIPMATTLEIDAVIDPADTRPWLLKALAPALSATTPRRGPGAGR